MTTADTLADVFSLNFTVTQDIHNTASTHHPSRLTDYKSRYSRSGDQENRRQSVLERQKQKRFDAANYARKLADGDLDEDEVEEATLDASMDVESKTTEKKRRFNPYKNQLMLSEWVVDPPADLQTNWLVVGCPVGKRVLVVAHRGYTKAYSKSGYLLNKFPSLLPGGSFKTLSKDANKNSMTLLDCIFDEVNNTYWILDLMCLNGHPVYESDTEFRFFWLHTKLLEDYPKIIKKSKVNPYIFQPLVALPCTADNLFSITEHCSYTIDGLLFFHRESHYQPGRTPLVGWLKPYMVPEILGLPMSEVIMSEAPVEFNKVILKEANVKLQTTLSDRSFNNPQSKKQEVTKKDDMES